MTTNHTSDFFKFAHSSYGEVSKISDPLSLAMPLIRGLRQT